MEVDNFATRTALFPRYLQGCSPQYLMNRRLIAPQTWLDILEKKNSPALASNRAKFPRFLVRGLSRLPLNLHQRVLLQFADTCQVLLVHDTSHKSTCTSAHIMFISYIMNVRYNVTLRRDQITIVTIKTQQSFAFYCCWHSNNIEVYVRVTVHLW